MRHGLLATAMDGWKHMVRGQIDLRNRVSRRWANQMLAHVFDHWRQLVPPRDVIVVEDDEESRKREEHLQRSTAAWRCSSLLRQVLI